MHLDWVAKFWSGVLRVVSRWYEKQSQFEVLSHDISPNRLESNKNEALNRILLPLSLGALLIRIVLSYRRSSIVYTVYSFVYIYIYICRYQRTPGISQSQYVGFRAHPRETQKADARQSSTSAVGRQHSAGRKGYPETWDGSSEQRSTYNRLFN